MSLRRRISDRVRRLWLRVTRRRLLRLDYPTSTDPRPRYGHGRPPHPELKALLDSHWPATEAALRTIAAHAGALGRIAVRDDSEREPTWDNGFVPALDGAALYTFAATRPLRRYVEVGSGTSTKFVARARRDHALDFTIASIDPSPRTEVDALCERVDRRPLELADLSVFESLESGDMVFMDASHRVFPNNDTTTFHLDVLPRLGPGVLVGVHDVMLPDDYSQWQIDQAFSEQYLLAAALLSGATRIRPVLPSWAVRYNAEANAILAPLWSLPVLRGGAQFGSAFWFETAGERLTS